ncbi:uncharacterized protein LOC123514613 [Portunus trituberculatus]|uniref:uncharacterized protein LOC123514613 n=1 Tax=Portunus trituberculatus TaxID=210409 RepID=UPI001E1CE3B1|nr:uncharacterized protein LOC123514613 [Portunus trituberculatus]XP_045128525.1 uncharacterized protein LOC123514613 [Portunus trituberculatus]
MALSWIFLVTGLVIALPAVHPHPQPHTHAMCVMMDRPYQGARQLLGGRLPHCLRGIKPFKHHRSVLRRCKNQVKKNLIMDRRDFKKDLLDPETMEGVMTEAWEGVAACLVEKLQLEAEDGTLDTKKLVRATAGMGGKDIWKVKYMRAMVITCADNTTANNATQQLKDVMECVREGALEFCESKMAFAKRWLQSSSEESVCSSVVVPPEPREACVACAEELGVSEAMCGSDGANNDTLEQEHSKAIHIPGSMQLDPEEAEWAVRLCASERLGWYRPTEGFLFTEMSEAIANFTGWEDIPQVRDNVTQTIVDCAPSFEGDVQVQAVLWTSCFMTTIFDTCGFRSNLTRMFFPGLRHTMRREVRQLMRGLVEVGDLGDDDDDDLDESDAELVDAGLLESSFMEETQMEDGGTDGPRVRSASMKDHSTSGSEKMDKQNETKIDHEPDTSEPPEDVSSDRPLEAESSGTPPGESIGTLPGDSTQEGSSGGMDETSEKVSAEPSEKMPDEGQ